MKKYIKPEITILEIEMGTGLMAASDEKTMGLNTEIPNEIDRSKGHTFSVWGEDDDDE